VNQLVNKIIDNVQISLKNVHVRYEDNVSNPGHPFAAGVTLSEVSALSTNSDWVPSFISELTNTTHKASECKDIDQQRTVHVYLANAVALVGDTRGVFSILEY
jgi:vacuolar protein sorting-associated protein 13A/C